jgi:hypothetical protein
MQDELASHCRFSFNNNVDYVLLQFSSRMLAHLRQNIILSFEILLGDSFFVQRYQSQLQLLINISKGKSITVGD